MNGSVLLTVASTLCAGALGAVGAITLSDSSGSDSVIASAEIDDLRRELASIQDDNEMLLERIEILETAPQVAPAPMRESINTAAIDTSHLDELIASLSNPEGGLPDNFRQEIGQVLTDIRAQEEKQRDEEREQRREDQKEERLARMAEELGLNPYQTNELREVWDDEEQKRNDLRDLMRETGDFQAMRDSMTAIREESTAALSAFMTQQQIEKYNETNTGGRGGFGGFGGGGRRGR